MFWRWFSSDRAVREALEQSQGYDMSPDARIMQAPANTDDAPNGQSKLTLWTDYHYSRDATQPAPQAADESWIVIPSKNHTLKD